MVDDVLRDGVRIAELLASEVTGHADPPYDALTVEDATLDVVPTVAGARAYDIAHDGDHLASVYVHPERAHLAFVGGLEPARRAAAERGLRVRPKAVDPPRLLVFLEDGAAAKRALGVLGAAAGQPGRTS